MAWNHQRHINQGLGDLVTQGLDFAHRLQFFHHVKEEEQGNEAQRDQGYSDDDLAIQQTPQGFHGRTSGAVVRRRRRRSVQLVWRLVSQSKPSTKAPPCKASKNMPNPTCPD